VSALLTALTGRQVEVEQADANTVRIKGLSVDQVGHLAFTAGVELHELSTQRFDLEDLFFALTSDAAPAAPEVPA
jgi:ABC-2 type transport system ATP-binding protein